MDLKVDDHMHEFDFQSFLDDLLPHDKRQRLYDEPSQLHGVENSCTRRPEAWNSMSHAEPTNEAFFSIVDGDGLTSQIIEDTPNWNMDSLMTDKITKSKASDAISAGPTPRPLHRSASHRCEVGTDGRSFRYPKDLHRHLLTHTYERKHKCAELQCEYATKGFSRKDALVRHVKAVHQRNKSFQFDFGPPCLD